MENANYRKLYATTKRQGIYIFDKEKQYINFSSNDYLNIGSNSLLQQEFLHSILSCDEALFSSASSRLLSGNSHAFTRLEENIATWYGKEKALIFNSGYQANMGIISALFTKEDAIFCDKLNHNSILAGIKHSEAKLYRYKHLDYNHLEDLLKKNRENHKNCLIVSESVFSMDGDIANIATLIDLKHRYNSMLMIDEAHAIGVFGENGQGLSYEHTGMADEVDLIMASLGKALGSHGAFCVANTKNIDTLINKAQTFIFSTAMSPLQAHWTNFILEDKRSFFLSQKQKLHTLQKSLGVNSPIIPHIIGESENAVKMANYLQSQGFFVLPVRPPTVPPHTARLRISLTADIAKHEIDALFTAIDKYKEANYA